MTDAEREREAGLAAFYALYLRQKLYSPERAWELVKQRYPNVRLPAGEPRITKLKPEKPHDHGHGTGD